MNGPAPCRGSGNPQDFHLSRTSTKNAPQARASSSILHTANVGKIAPSAIQGVRRLTADDSKRRGTCSFSHQISSHSVRISRVNQVNLSDKDTDDRSLCFMKFMFVNEFEGRHTRLLPDQLAARRPHPLAARQGRRKHVFFRNLQRASA